MKKIICNRCGADITEGARYHLNMTVNAADVPNGNYDICPDCWKDVEPVINGEEEEENV